MREYGTVSPQFWIGKTGKALRGKPEAQLLALYLMTCPHANMIGVFHCPIMYMAHETGMGSEGASKALQSLIDLGFCMYDHDTETVFVIRMAAHQVGDNLKADDNKVKGVHKEVSKIAVPSLRAAFIEFYKGAYHFTEAPSKPLPSPTEPPSKQLTGAGAGTGAGPEGGGPDGPSALALVSGTDIGHLCKRIRQEAKLMGVNPSDPKLIALRESGYSDETIFDACREAADKGKPWGWAFAAIQNRAAEAAKVKAAPPAEDRTAKFVGGI
jgi:hypothetical protein